MRLPLPLGQKSDKARYPGESIERLLNCYLERVPDGKEPTPIYGEPGLVKWCEGLSGPVRGAKEVGGVAYVLAGTRLYRIDAARVETDLGEIPGADLVSMAGDGTNLVVVAGGEIYVWNGTILGPVTDPDAPNASSVEYVDGFYVFGELDTEQWFISALRDPTNYDALDFASAEWKADKLIRPVRLRNTLYLAGATSFEAQQNTGAAAFPFSAYTELKIDIGLAGLFAILTTNDTMAWLANDLTIRRLDGLTASVISTPAVGRIIKAWTDPSLTVASAHVHDHHLRYVFRNPDGCVIYDQTTERWLERETYGHDTWIARQGIECYGRRLFGSATEGTVYALDEDAYDDAGELMVREIVTPPAYVQNKRLTITELELVCETGVGSPTLNPEITCERTKDNRVWGGMKRRRLGKQAQGNGRVLFGMQGQARAMSFRFRCTDRVKFAVYGAYAEADVEA